jgi:hypothetical protein
MGLLAKPDAPPDPDNDLGEAPLMYTDSAQRD